MPRRNMWLCFVLVVLLTSCCDGRIDEEEERPAVKGSHHLSYLGSVVKPEPSAPARPGSLTFRYDQQGDFSSTKVSQDTLAAKFKRLNPSVQCGDNQMTLTVSRVKAPHFLVDGGDEPIPLAEMPASCGFSVKRSRRHVQYAASYQGCHVNKEDGDHLLPLLFQGAPMTMSCPNMLTSPAVVCSPSKMVVKLGGVAAKDLKIKVSGTWQPLSSTCSSCGLTFKEVSGELALIAPYNTDLCIEFKDGEFSLSLQWGDYELLAVCPVVPDINPTPEATPPSSDVGQVLQHPQDYLQMFSQMLQPWPTSSPAPGAPLPLFFVATNPPENQKVSEVQSPALSFMPQVPQFFVFPRPETPAQTSGIESTPVKQVQFPQMPQPLQYQVPIFSEFPMVPGIVQQMTSSPLPASNTETLPTSEPAMASEDKFQLPLQSEYSVPQHPFPSFFELPFLSQDKTQVVDNPETDINQLQPHPQVFQFPIVYSPRNYPSQGQNMLTFTAAPATTSTSAAPTNAPLPEKAFYPPHSYVPVFLLPEQPSVPVFLHPPTNSAPSAQHEPVYHILQPFYPFLPNQRQTEPTGS